jgi:hypothetical protein
MTDILGFQEIKICEPHGNKYIIVVQFDGDYLICYDPDSPPPFNWVKLKEGPEDYGYTFYNLKKEEYNINWNINDIQNLDNKSIGKISLCNIFSNINPIIIELISIEEHSKYRKLKLKIPEQILYKYETEEQILFEPKVNTHSGFYIITIHHEDNKVVLNDDENEETVFDNAT